MTQEMADHLETVEITEYIEMNNALERLENNSDFKKVILDGYIKNKALGAVSCLGLPSFKQQGGRGDLIEELVAISNLQYYFEMIKNMGSSAKADAEALANEDN